MSQQERKRMQGEMIWGMTGLDKDQIYTFNSQPARRIHIGGPTAGKPEIHVMANGELLSAYSRNYSADLSKSIRMIPGPMYNEVRWSSDGGMTWSEPVMPISPDAIGSNYEGRIIQLPDGRLLMATVGRDHSGPHIVSTGPYLTESKDFGRTWSAPWKMDCS
ncbi:MAG: exo-alpha-sialidase, partial [Candidatus Latescibacteria bacterium]|nr:exo-alpha-sialidase [Candidatus Latescibacterota bacterium]